MAAKKQKDAPSSAKAEKKDALSPEALDQEIKNAAKKIFEDRQARHLAGDAMSDWLKAEAEVKKRHKL